MTTPGDSPREGTVVPRNAPKEPCGMGVVYKAHERRSGRLVVIIFSLSLWLGCTNPFGRCEGLSYPAVLLTVVDSTTGLRPSTNLVVQWNNGVHSGTLPVEAANGPPIQLPVAVDETGTFAVTVDAAGYMPWTRNGIVVARSGRCGDIETKTLTAKLVPSP